MRIPDCTHPLAIILLALSSSSTAAAADFEKLSMPEGLAIPVDPMKSTIVSEPFNVTNGTAKPSDLSLHIEAFVAASNHLPPHGATARLFLNGIESTKLPNDGLTSVLAPKDTIFAKIEIDNFIESGDYSLTLYNGPLPIGSIRVTGAPFKVHTEAATGTAIPVIVGPDSFRIAIRNDDAVTYPVHWELTFGSATFKSGRDAILHPGATDIFYRTDKTQDLASTVSEDRWNRFCRYLRDSSYDGQLRVTLAAAEGSQTPSKEVEQFAPAATFPVKVSLRHQSPELTTIIGSLVLVFVLTLGAIASLIATLYIPHTLRKNALQSRLLLAIRRVRELSARMPSRGRISAEVDCFQIAGRLRNEGAFYSDFDAILQDYETQVSAIESRVSLMSQVDGCQQLLEGITTMAVPPSLIAMAREPLEQLNKMFDGGEWTDEQLRTAAVLVDSLQRRVSSLTDVKSSGRIDADVQNKIKSELARMKACFSPSPRTGFAARFADALPGIFAILDGTAGDIPDLPSFDWAQLDVALWKLSMVWRFVKAYEATKNPAWRTRLEDRAGLSGDRVQNGSLLYYLELSTWDALTCADLLCAQVDQGIFPEDICDAIRDGRFSIQILQKQVTSERRVDVEISFSNYAYNNAAARYEITPRWTFTPRHPRSLRARLWNWLRKLPGAAEPRKEEGWVVSCLARPYRSVEARVCFVDWCGALKVKNDEGTSATYPIESNATGLVWPRFLMELSKLALGLAIPILGLLAGAREKLLTMDVSAALATVFVLGFGADTIKSALTRGTVTAPGPTPPKSSLPGNAAGVAPIERTPVPVAR